MAWVKRFCFNVRKRHKSDRKSGTLSLEEIRGSENEWIMAAMREPKQDSNYQQLVSKFGLRADGEGLVRCKGRLEYSDLECETREPIILPKKHHLTFLEIKQRHVKVLHSGVRSTLAELRSRFWVPKGRQVVKRVLN